MNGSNSFNLATLENRVFPVYYFCVFNYEP